LSVLSRCLLRRDGKLQQPPALVGTFGLANMAYFLPSFFQKRLLRYALSRLELLDTDALDLERLDIAWGKRSTVELRDVGLRLKVNSH